MRWAWLALAMCSCGAPPEATSDTFIATVADFAGYASWQSFFIANADAQASSHVSGDRTIFLNHAPPHGSTAFPIGTVVLKTFVSSPQIFAMAKRADGFNADGAVGWEWFQLQASPELSIVWRGVTAPAGGQYGDATSCNNCHTGAWANDFVQSDLLSLQNF